MKQVQKQLYQFLKDFIKKAVKKSDARPFKVSDEMTLMVVDPLTGQKAKFDPQKIQLWRLIKVKMLWMEKFYIQIKID